MLQLIIIVLKYLNIIFRHILFTTYKLKTHFINLFWERSGAQMSIRNQLHVLPMHLYSVSNLLSFIRKQLLYWQIRYITVLFENSFVKDTHWAQNALVVLAKLDICNGFGIWSLGLSWALHCSHRHYSWVASKPFPSVLGPLGLQNYWAPQTWAGRMAGSSGFLLPDIS